MTDKVPLMFHNLRGFDSHLMMLETGKFNVRIGVIPNELEKYMVVTINKIWFLLAACNLWILV